MVGNEISIKCVPTYINHFDHSIAIWKCRNKTMLEGKVVNTSQQAHGHDLLRSNGWEMGIIL